MLFDFLCQSVRGHPVLEGDLGGIALRLMGSTHIPTATLGMALCSGDKLLCEGQGPLLASVPGRGTLYVAVTSRRVAPGFLFPLRSLGP